MSHTKVSLRGLARPHRLPVFRKSPKEEDMVDAGTTVLAPLGFVLLSGNIYEKEAEAPAAQRLRRMVRVKAGVPPTVVAFLT